ncbi:MAG: exopolyphosphatase, partial [Oceanisphaera sp.]|nr:exopolyphosphatase [Oceanisphaera sp.]
TIKTLLEMCSAVTGESCIDLPGLLHIRAQMINAGHIDRVNISGLGEDRKPLIAAGLSILLGLFRSLNLARMDFSDGALREGLLYSTFGRRDHHSVQAHTLQALSSQYAVDSRQAERVRDTALALFEPLRDSWQLDQEAADLLAGAAQLHEVGLHINFTGIHRHSAYILRHSDLPGFTLEQQKILAALVRFHRKALKLSELEPLGTLPETQLWRLVRLLRLAVALHRRRQNNALPPLVLELGEQDALRLRLPADWCEHNPLLLTTLQREQDYQAKIGWKLELIQV